MPHVAILAGGSKPCCREEDSRRNGGGAGGAGGEIQREGVAEASIPAWSSVRVSPAIPAGGFGAQSSGAAGHSPERALPGGEGKDYNIFLLGGENGVGVGEGLLRVQAGEMDDGERGDEARAVVQVSGVQRGAEDVLGEGDGVHTDEDGGGSDHISVQV